MFNGKRDNYTTLFLPLNPHFVLCSKLCEWSALSSSHSQTFRVHERSFFFFTALLLKSFLLYYFQWLISRAVSSPFYALGNFRFWCPLVDR